MQKRTKESQKRINSLILLIAFTAVLLIVSTYAWFTTQKDVTISDLRGTIEVAEGLQLSFDGDIWGQEFDLDEVDLSKASDDASFDKSKYNYGTWKTGVNFEPVELLPASTQGTVGNAKLNFYRGTLDKNTLKEIKLLQEDSSLASNAVDTAGYFAFDIFLKNTSRDDEPDTLQLDSNSYVWSLIDDVTKNVSVNGNTVSRTYEGDYKAGLQNTVRVGLAFYNANSLTVTSEKADVKAMAEAATTKIDRVAIWEPNADRHSDQAVKTNNKFADTLGYFKDVVRSVPSTWSTEKTNNAKSVFKTSALTDASKDQSITNIYNVPTAQASYVGEQKTMQTTQRVKSPDDSIDPRIAGMVDAWNVDYSGQAAQNLRLSTGQNADGSTDVIKLPANSITKCRVYVWVEGQDVDCFNYASFGGGIQLDLGLAKDRDLSTKNEDRIKDESGKITAFTPEAAGS